MEPLVSVNIATYNHKLFIVKCIESVLMQKTNFPIEVIIHDDASTDGTSEIVREYAQKNENVVAIIQDFNLWSKGQNPTVEYGLLSSKGKYIAICDGDDFWTDEYKLQKQFDFLESNKDFSICSSNAIVVNEYNRTQTDWLGFRRKNVFLLRDLLRYGSCGATCTLFFRTEAIKNIPDWFYISKGGDWSLQILCTTIGKMKYLNESFAVYRRNEGSITVAKTIEAQILLHEKYGIETIKLLKKYFSSYESELQKHEAEYWLYTLACLYSEKRDFIKVRELIIEIFKKINILELPIKKSLFLLYLYLKTTKSKK
jgi:glycosyltransferase involved in cell wall biosynthesis